MRARVVVTFLVFLCSTTSHSSRARADEPAAKGDADARERSRAAFRKGVAQLRAQDWASARSSFELAMTLYPHPSILLNLGIARLRTDESVLAEQDLVRFLSEDVGAAAEELASAREALAEARAKNGTLRVVVTPASSRVAVDGKAIETVRRAEPGAGSGQVGRGQDVVAEVRTKPGFHMIAVDAEGFTSERREVQVNARGEAVVTVALVRVDVVKPPAPTGPNTRAIVGWSLAGLSGAALITGGITALRARTLADGYGDPASAQFQDAGARSDGITFRTAADVALSVAVLSGGAALVLLLTDLGKGSSDVLRVNTLRW
jgi:hypothetical protein